MKTIELLAPARDYATGVAAVDCGADAIYIGGSGFGARKAASNTTEDVARLVKYAHAFGVRVYATLNTIIYESELEAARKAARELIAAGVDALIVQDMAFMRMNLDGVEIHASTQTYNATSEHVKFLQESGFSRVILERGLSLEQIKAIRNETQVDLECFIHGAICVGNSGQCYLSRSMGTRSGNRGECGQPCRLSYDLVDGYGNALMRDKHLLSVKDMNLSPCIGKLIQSGVTSFKIEGRLKDVNYVRNIVGHYRKLIDTELALRKDLRRSSFGKSALDFTPDPRRSFTRSGSTYFIDGKVKGVATIDSPKAIGTFVGKVTTLTRDSFDIASAQSLAAGDGICFFCNGELLGTNINRVDGNKVFPNRMDGIVRGTDIFCNYDHSFSMSLERSHARRIMSVSAKVETSATRIILSMRAESGAEVVCLREGEFAQALNAPKMFETIKTQIARSGDTIFSIDSISIQPSAPYFVPVSMIAEMRREALEELYRKLCDSSPARKIVTENKEFSYTTNHLDARANVVNSLAESFYHEHGVTVLERGLDECVSLIGEIVMTSPYCIRREIGECLRENAKLRGELFLRRGAMSYRLDFDCSACMMRLIKEK